MKIIIFSKEYDDIIDINYKIYDNDKLQIKIYAYLGGINYAL